MKFSDVSKKYTYKPKKSEFQKGMDVLKDWDFLTNPKVPALYLILCDDKEFLELYNNNLYDEADNNLMKRILDRKNNLEDGNNNEKST
jgi:hypothetical protein